MLGRILGLSAVCTLLVVAACGDDAAEPGGFTPNPFLDGGGGPDTGATLEPPPPITGTYRWYSEIAPAHDVGKSFAVGSDGRVAIAFSPTRAGNAGGKPFTHFGPGTATPNYDLLVAVFDRDGKAQWVRTFATAEIEAASGIAFDEAGDVYVSGSLKDNADGLAFGGGIDVPVGPGELSAFLVKLRGSDGSPVWATPIVSAGSYVKPSCNLSGRELAVRGNRVVLGCVFDSGNDNARQLKVGATEIAGASANLNSVLVDFEPTSGQYVKSYVSAGALEGGTLRLTVEGGAIVGGRIGDACVVFGVGNGSEFFRRRFERAGSSCFLSGVAIAAGRLWIGGFASGDLDLGDGVTAADAGADYGFYGEVALGEGSARGSSIQRYPGAKVFGVATDVWDQTFVARSEGTTFRYEKRDAAGGVVFASKTYALATGGSPSFQGMALGVDGAGALKLFGGFRGTLTFDDGIARGGDADYRLFAARFAP